jgi:hypothetical protein
MESPRTARTSPRRDGPRWGPHGCGTREPAGVGFERTRPAPPQLIERGPPHGRGGPAEPPGGSVPLAGSRAAGDGRESGVSGRRRHRNSHPAPRTCRHDPGAPGRTSDGSVTGRGLSSGSESEHRAGRRATLPTPAAMDRGGASASIGGVGRGIGRRGGAGVSAGWGRNIVFGSADAVPGAFAGRRAESHIVTPCCLAARPTSRRGAFSCAGGAATGSRGLVAGGA